LVKRVDLRPSQSKGKDSKLKEMAASFAPTQSVDVLAAAGGVASASDEALLSLYQAGRMDAFNALYQRHEGALYRYILGMVQRRHLASDLFQEVWVAVIRAHAELGGKPFAPWLYTVARNRVIDHMRLAKNVVMADPDHEAAGDDSSRDEVAGDNFMQDGKPYDLADLLHNQRMGEALMKCVQELPDLQREAFILQADTEMRIEEIAEMTQSPVETIKSRLRYARNTIRKQMEGWR
jgi:RNA polymerase sigma factor (sigma-70 family)